MSVLDLKPIGYIKSCYQEKFGIPRQSGLVTSASSVIVLPKNPDMEAALRGIEEFSHLWVLFLFHQLKRPGWKPHVRPPRLGGEKTVGVFASRSPHRPNPIGMSAVALTKLEMKTDICLHVGGGDFLDGTPVLDIKPYLPYADAVSTAHAGWANDWPECCPVEFSPQASQQLTALPRPEGQQGKEALTSLIRQTLAQDPRPSYQRRLYPKGMAGKQWTMRLSDLDITWSMVDGLVTVDKITIL